MAARPRVTVHKTPAAAVSAEAEAQSPAPAAAPATPSEELIRAAIQPTVVKAGRHKILMRKPSVLAQFTLTDAMGESSGNEALMRMVLPLIYIGEIDGEAIPTPQNRLQVDALITRLGDDGITAVMTWYLETIVAPTLAAIESAKHKASVKN
jgi:hypothetical protein